MRPRHGLGMPCTLDHVVDGDTVHVLGVATDWNLKLRLVDCWCPELRSKDEFLRDVAERGRDYAKELIDRADLPLTYFIPADRDDLYEMRQAGKRLNPLELTTFKRVPAELWLSDDYSLNERMVAAGLASTKRGGELGR